MMPAYDAFCRTPLVDPACVVLSDSAVHVEGTLQRLIQQALDTVDLTNLSSLDALLATKLGGYTDLPPMPDLTAAVEYLPANPRVFIDAVRAGLMNAAAGKNKNAMLSVLTAMRAFTDALPEISEAALIAVGADTLRIISELYRRTGQRFLLILMERLRAQLPDVSGMFRSFPFQKPFEPEPIDEQAMDETSMYHRRMRLLGTGKLTADALAMTAQLAMFSGSARDAGASKLGVTALQRYHGMPHGSFSADPYLAGRDGARASNLEAICAQLEALHDLLAASGDVAFAEMMERIAENALANLFGSNGICAAETVNRFALDATCKAEKATQLQTSALLRAVYALRRSIWMVKGEAELAMLLPYEGCCLTRMDGTPVRLRAAKSNAETLTIQFETKQPVEFAFSLHIPGYATKATIAINNSRPQTVECGKLHTVQRLYKTGDVVTLHLECQPFMENGYRNSASVYCGPLLMALPLPNEEAGWQYAIDEESPLKVRWENGRPRVQVDACDAPQWEARNGKVMPPPQGIGMSVAYELTLLPYADTQGRIAAFPQARRV